MKLTGVIKIVEASETGAIENSIIYHRYDAADATVDSPNDVLIHKWMINAEIKKVEWIDRQSGNNFR